jgi:hypothetical protein
VLVKDLLRQALHDAIDWQLSLADAWQKGTPERKEAMDQANRYRAVLKRRYGTDKTALDAMIDAAEYVTLDDLRKKHEST